ncbi:MAG: hypothetical protein AB7G87_13925 [Clostridia bacterium]
MTNLAIRNIVIEGFKGYKERVSYSFGKKTILSGGNGLGKSSAGEAIVWTFLGCNMWGNISDSVLMNHNSRKTKVFIEFDFNEHTYTLERRRASGGVKIFLNGRVSTQTEIIEKFGIDKKTFLCIFNPLYYDILSNAEAKDFLTSFLPFIGIEEVLSNLPEYSRKVLEDLDLLDPEELLSSLRENLRELDKAFIYNEGKRDSINLKVEIPNEMCFDNSKIFSLEKQLEELNGKKPKLKNIADLTKLKAEYEKEIITLNSQKSSLLDTRELEFEKIRLQSELKRIKESKYFSNRTLADLESDVKSLRTQYSQLRSQKAKGGESCPVCQRILPDSFDDSRFSKELADIESKGVTLSRQLAQAKAEEEAAIKKFNEKKEFDVENINKKICDIEKKLHNINTANTRMQNDLQKQTSQKISLLKNQIQELGLEEIEEYNRKATQKFNAEIGEERSKIKKQLEQLRAAKRKVDENNVQRKMLLEKLEADKAQFEKYTKMLQEIPKEKTKLEIKINEVQSFVNKRIELITKEIHKHFDKVTLKLNKLIKTTGESKDCFEIQYDGKDFKLLSTSEKIRAGLEIGNFIMDITGLRYPVFIDQGESISTYTTVAEQIIEGIVVKDQGQIIIHQEEAFDMSQNKEENCDNAEATNLQNTEISSEQLSFMESTKAFIGMGDDKRTTKKAS